MINLLLVDDEKLIREGLSILFEGEEDFTVLATAGSGQEALQMVKEHPVDVVLMDLRMPSSDGIEGTRLIKSYKQSIKVLILTTFKDAAYLKDVMAYGASGYLLKDTGFEEIKKAILSVCEGSIVLHPEISRVLLESEKGFRPEDYGLTPREMEILLSIARGKSNQEIAEELFLSQGTVKNYISGILDKLDLRDRTQIAIFAYQNKLL